MALAFLGFGFLTTRVERAEEALAAIAVDIADLELERRAAAQFSALEKTRGPDIERISNFSVTRDRPIRLLEDVERAAADASTTISVAVDEDAGSQAALVFRISSAGSEENVSRFLRLIEFLPYDIAIRAVALQMSGRRRFVSSDSDVERPAELTLRLHVATASAAAPKK